MKWVVSVILSALISSLVSASLVIFVANKLGLAVDLRNNGIKRIYDKGQSVKSLEKLLKSGKCKKLQVLGFSAEGFTHTYRKELSDFIAGGGKLEYLLARPGTAFTKQASEMEGRGENVIDASIQSALGLIDVIRKNAEDMAGKSRSECGSIAVRFYETEIRNQLILGTDVENRTVAWMTLLTPPLAAVNCRMIEFSEVADCQDYFNTVWRRAKER